MLTEETKMSILEDFFCHRKGDVLEWLREKGFYDAPAAVKHHGNYPGGLFDHSLQVAYELIQLTQRLDLRWQRDDSPAVVGILHDVCKLDDYIITRKEMDEVHEISPEYNKEKIMPGHGEKSLILLMGHIDLTDEEIMCIRYHMGPYEGQQAWEYYSRAIRSYPNVLYTHTADMIASQIKGI